MEKFEKYLTQNNFFFISSPFILNFSYTPIGCGRLPTKGIWLLGFITAKSTKVTIKNQTLKWGETGHMGLSHGRARYFFKVTAIFLTFQEAEKFNVSLLLTY